MSSRYQKLGIKQTIQPAWMDKTVQLMLAGMSEKEIRIELDSYLSVRKQSGGIGERGKKTYTMAISLLAAWFAPEEDLIPLRDDLLDIAKVTAVEKWLPLHWAVISASYPFWFNVARQTGRLLKLQDIITQKQVFGRLKEQYGDRETVVRNARYAVRSFVAWNVIQDSNNRGYYKKAAPNLIDDQRVATLLLEAALHTIPERKATSSFLNHNPGFFPFELPKFLDQDVKHINDRIDVMRYHSDESSFILK